MQGQNLPTNLTLDDNTVLELKRRLQTQLDSESEADLVQIEGYATSHRRLGSSFCFLDISKRGISEPVQAMLKREVFGNPTRFDGCMKSLVPGVRLQIIGQVSPTKNPGEALILIQDLKILKLPHNPQHVRKLLKLVNDGFLQASDLAGPTNMSEPELWGAIQKSKENIKNPNHPKLFNGLAKRILEDLKDEIENDMEYPVFTTDHKYNQHLPTPSPDIQMLPKSLMSDSSPVRVSIAGQPEPVQSILDNLKKACPDKEEEKKECVKTIHLVGWVQNRRRFRGSITVIEMVDEMVNIGTAFKPISKDQQVSNPQDDQQDLLLGQRLKCIIHPQVLENNHNSKNNAEAETYGHLASPGSQMRLIGRLIHPHRDGETSEEKIPIVWVSEIRLLKCSWRPNVVRFLIEQVVQEKFDSVEAAQALGVSNEELQRIIAIDDLTKRQWECAEISRALQRQSTDLSLQMRPEALAVLDDFEDLRNTFPVHFVDVKMPSIVQSDFISTQGSRWKRQKEPQLEWMAQQVQQVLERSHPEHFTTKGVSEQDPIQILDVGGGKGFLANYLSSRLLEVGCPVKILVLDVAEGAIHNGRLRTERRNLSHVVEYVVADASTVDLSDTGGIDLVVALHACGALTDVALGHAVAHKASFVICPCCFCSNPQLLVASKDHDAPMDQRKPMLPVEEWLNVSPNQYQTIKNLAEIQGDIRLANRAIHTICALRSSAVESRSESRINVTVRMFPVAFSTRNFCLVGSRGGS